MIPHFSNPHLLPQFTEIVSRSEIYASNDIDTNESTEYNSDLYSQFNKCFKYVLLQPHPEASLSRKRKREEEAVLENGTSQAFRLVSSALPPLPISILPPPRPPPLTREPDVEDDEEQALLRKWRAEAASLEAETILHESNTNKSLRHSDKTSKLRYLRATSDYTQANLMIIRTLQRHRKTRPPISLSNISAFPYVPDISTISLPPVQSRCMDCSVVDAEDIEATLFVASKKNRPRRRRKHDVETKDRPQPQFWRPDPAWTGKCRGYAYGYPSNLSCRSGTQSRRYQRDSMKKAVYSNS